MNICITIPKLLLYHNQGLRHEVIRVVQGGVVRKSSNGRITTIITPLHRLVQHTKRERDDSLLAEAVGALLDAKANPNTVDTHYRRTALMDACWVGRGISILQRLLEPSRGQFQFLLFQSSMNFVEYCIPRTVTHHARH